MPPRGNAFANAFAARRDRGRGAFAEPALHILFPGARVPGAVRPRRGRGQR